jgi:hypothetical protein
VRFACSLQPKNIAIHMLQWRKMSLPIESRPDCLSLESYILVAIDSFFSCMWAELRYSSTEIFPGNMWVVTKIFSVACGSQLRFFSSCTWGRSWVFLSCMRIATKICSVA